MPQILQTIDLRKVYRMGEVEVAALKGVDFACGRRPQLAGCHPRHAGGSIAFHQRQSDG